MSASIRTTQKINIKSPVDRADSARLECQKVRKVLSLASKPVLGKHTSSFVGHPQAYLGQEQRGS